MISAKGSFTKAYFLESAFASAKDRCRDDVLVPDEVVALGVRLAYVDEWHAQAIGVELEVVLGGDARTLRCEIVSNEADPSAVHVSDDDRDVDEFLVAFFESWHCCMHHYCYELDRFADIFDDPQEWEMLPDS